jgi:sulfatase modifying factor 1
MSIVGKRAETSDPRHSFAAATFRKVLKGFEIGGLPYTEVEFQLKRLLATGVSPGELREVLRRSELIEPLPEYAYREVLGLLDEAIEQGAAEQSDPIDAITQEEQLDPAALSAELLNARSALESEQTRAREAEEALSERIAAEETLRSRLDMTLRESERYQGELRAARSSMASRDKVTAQMRLTLDARDAELAALRAELETLTSSNAQIGIARDSLAAQNKMLAEMRQALAERDAQCVALQRQHAEALAALETERHKSQETERSLTHGNSQIGAARESLASQNKTLAEMRKSLADRDTQLAALRQGHTKAIAESEGRAQKTEEKLQATQRRVAAANTDLDGLRAQVANLHSKLRDGNALIEKLGASVRSEAKRAAQWQAAARQRDPTAAVTLPRAEVLASPGVSPPVEVSPRAHVAQALSVLSRFRLIVRDRRWNFRAPPRAAGIGAAIVLLAMALWFVVHRAAPLAVPSNPAPEPAVAMQPGTTVRDCPTCPVLTVLPAGRFEQGSSPAENGSAFEKPPHWVMIAHPIALSTNAVTVDEYREFIAATGRDMQGCDTYDGEWRHRAENNWENPGFVQTGAHPVTCTSWNDAKAYVAWLSAKTGQRYRLPSASEWEYAARAGGMAAQPWSAEGSGACTNANVADQSAAHRYPGWAVFACNDGFVQTAPVGSFKANSFGLNDMLGNVFQWTEDCWNADYKGAPIDGAARMDGDCAERELRGGSWFSTPSFVRANYRNHFGVDYRTSSVGIRLARDIAP